MPIKSMTGYGKGEATVDNITMSVEIKTVNHRYLDVSIKLPRTLMAFENGLKKKIGSAIGRGKIDVYINYELTGDAEKRPSLDQDLAIAYFELFNHLKEHLKLTDQISINHLISQKDVVQIKESDLDEEVLNSCLDSAADKAITSLISMRKAEGQELRSDVHDRLKTAEEILEQIVKRAPDVPLEWQQRLKERLERLEQNFEWDPQRIAQEVAVFADRCDISEEITRFKSHLGQFREMLEDDEPVGRRMDFLTQELNREVNTMGSKSNDVALTKAVVALKSELEKIREQVQNVE